MDKTIIKLNEFQYESSPFAYLVKHTVNIKLLLMGVCAHTGINTDVYFMILCKSINVLVQEGYYARITTAHQTKFPSLSVTSSSKASHNTHFHIMFLLQSYNSTTLTFRIAS